jgi:hypothetical protein
MTKDLANFWAEPIELVSSIKLITPAIAQVTFIIRRISSSPSSV